MKLNGFWLAGTADTGRSGLGGLIEAPPDESCIIV
jgi:hypothetical protein